jgi:hypothetical protein
MEAKAYRNAKGSGHVVKFYVDGELFKVIGGARVTRAAAVVYYRDKNGNLHVEGVRSNIPSAIALARTLIGWGPIIWANYVEVQEATDAPVAS